ncbi:MAG: hypothetical protein WC309_01470 [Candidatus Paceibacterota bacterium]|jgi:hypothetical protein
MGSWLHLNGQIRFDVGAGAVDLSEEETLEKLKKLLGIPVQFESSDKDWEASKKSGIPEGIESSLQYDINNSLYGYNVSIYGDIRVFGGCSAGIPKYKKWFKKVTSRNKNRDKKGYNFFTVRQAVLHLEWGNEYWIFVIERGLEGEGGVCISMKQDLNIIHIEKEGCE